MPSEETPLLGKTVVVTRSREQAAELVAQLEDLGAAVLEFPTIRIADPESWEPVDAAIRNLEVYRWVIFTSANAVDRFFERVDWADKDARALASAQVACVGPATAARCMEHGIRPDFVPEDFRAEGVLEGFCERGLGLDTRVLIPRAFEAREILPDTLRERGAIVDVVPVYRTVLGDGDPETLEALRAGRADVVTFTSGSTARNFVKLAEGLDLAALGVAIASIGPVTSEVVRKLGMPVDIEAEESTIPALVEAIEEHFGA